MNYFEDFWRAYTNLNSSYGDYTTVKTELYILIYFIKLMISFISIYERENEKVYTDI